MLHRWHFHQFPFRKCLFFTISEAVSREELEVWVLEHTRGTWYLVILVVHHKTIGHGDITSYARGRRSRVSAAARNFFIHRCWVVQPSWAHDVCNRRSATAANSLTRVLTNYPTYTHPPTRAPHIRSHPLTNPLTYQPTCTILFAVRRYLSEMVWYATSLSVDGVPNKYQSQLGRDLTESPSRIYERGYSHDSCRSEGVSKHCSKYLLKKCPQNYFSGTNSVTTEKLRHCAI